MRNLRLKVLRVPKDKNYTSKYTEVKSYRIYVKEQILKDAKEKEDISD